MQIKQPQINLTTIRFPKELESAGISETIRRILLVRTIKIRQDSNFDVPRIELGKPLEDALRKSRLRGQIRCGFEDIVDKLKTERIGIASVRRRTDAPYGNRISRLLLFSNDGAERLYRHIEEILKIHSPRILGCLLNIDSAALGKLINQRESKIKIVMAEHKDAVCEILRAMIASSDVSSK
ncbi:MAG: hypothetical protein ABFD75_06015 [Smithella sp.]